MEVRQCKRCNKIFQYTNNPLCQVCIQEVDKQFNDVRNYIYENPTATLEDVCEKTDVTPNTLRRWLKEGRLILNKGNAAMLNCESCGALIVVGRFCDACTAKVKGNLGNVATNLQQSVAEEAQRQQFSRQDDKNRNMHLNPKNKR